MFHFVFDENPRSKKRLFRTVLVSVLMTFSIAVMVNGHLFSTLGVIGFLMSYVVMSLYPAYVDVFSLYTSYHILKKMALTSSWRKQLLLLVLDLFSSIMFGFIVLCICLGYIPNWYELESLYADPSWFEFYIPIMISSFLTSIWIYIFLLGTYLIKLFIPMRLGVGRLLRLFNLKKYPFSAIAFVGGWSTVLIGLVLALIF